MDKTADSIRSMADSIRAQIVQDRRYLHQIPEIGMDLPETSAYIRKRLDEMGIPWKECGGDVPEKMTEDFIQAGFPRMEKATGVTAVIGKGSPCILLRADMDALPIREENDLEFKSCNGMGHMCGHDSHAAMLLGAAQILKNMEDQLAGTVKLMFQPGEETGAGARMMVGDGLLEEPKVDAAFGIHVQPTEETGTVGYSMGVNSASLDTFIVKIRGKGGHSSRPHQSRDPVFAACSAVVELQSVVSRRINPLRPAVLSICRIAGGELANVIPDEVVLEGTARAFDPDVAQELKSGFQEIVEAVCHAHRVECDIHYDILYPVNINPAGPTDFAREVIRETFGEERLYEMPEPSMGGEDFAYFLQRYPGVYVKIGLGETHPALHNSKFDFPDSALSIGIEYFVNFVRKTLSF